MTTAFPSVEANQCPFPLYAHFREQGPIYRLATGEYVVSRHRDIVEITRQPAIFSSRHSIYVDGYLTAASLEDLDKPDLAWGLTRADPPEHTWKRKIAFEMFKPGRLREREPLVRGYVEELIDGFVERGECEFVHEFAEKLPAMVILTLFGLSLDHLERAIAWGRYEGFGTRFASQESQRAAADAIIDLGAFVKEEVLERADHPGDDEMSLHVQQHIAHRGRLDVADAIAEVSNLFVGGIVTTTHLISSMMLLFIEHPDQQEKARSDSPMLKRAVEESLRLESPVQLGPRLVVEDTEVGGVPIPRGSIVLVVWASGNRDEEIFECPAAFDVERPNAKDHVAFGNGPHFCLGAPLGRMEATVAFERIFARLANLRFAPGKNDFANHRTVIFRGPQELHIEFDAVPA